MSFVFKRRKKRAIPNLQLTSLIDIFSILIIFLIKGTSLANTEVVVPKNMSVPESISTEQMDIAPNVILQNHILILKIINEKIPLDDLITMESPQALLVKNKLTLFVKQSSKEMTKSGALVNLVADKSESYKNIFTVTNFLKVSGFNSVLLISRGGE